jgi:hypothetical protein
MKNETSKLAELNSRLQVFKELVAEEVQLVSYEWAMEKILGFTKEEISTIKEKK